VEQWSGGTLVSVNPFPAATKMGLPAAAASRVAHSSPSRLPAGLAVTGALPAGPSETLMASIQGCRAAQRMPAAGSPGATSTATTSTSPEALAVSEPAASPAVTVPCPFSSRMGMVPGGSRVLPHSPKLMAPTTRVPGT
jgi:hypothetical protein